MKIKRIFITLCAACAVSMVSFAQTARQVLDQTASKLKNSGGIEAAFRWGLAGWDVFRHARMGCYRTKRLSR